MLLRFRFSFLLVLFVDHLAFEQKLLPNFTAISLKLHAV